MQPFGSNVTVDTDTATAGNQTQLTFTVSDWNVGQTVTITVASDADAADDSTVIVHSASGADYDGITGSVVVNVDDDETAEVSGPSATLASTEPTSGTATSTYTIKLSAPPTGTVTVGLSVVAVTPAQVSGVAWTDPDVSVSSETVTLTSSNWEDGVQVTVSVGVDSDAEDDVARIDHTVTQSTNSMEYNGFSLTSTTVNVTDPETAKVEFKQSTTSTWEADPRLEMNDGGTLSLDVRLSHQPRGDVSVSVTLPSGSGLTVTTPSSSTLQFPVNSWSTTRTMRFEFNHVKDDNSFNEKHELGFSVSGYISGTVQDLTLTMNDTDAVESELVTLDGLTPTDGAITVVKGSFWAYQIKLSCRPSTFDGNPATVSVVVTSSNPDVTVSPNPVVLDINNWEAGAEFIATAGEDDDGAGDTATLTHVATSTTNAGDGDYHNVSIGNVTVTVTENDTPDVLFEDTMESAGAHSVSFDQGGTKIFKVKLSTEPTGAVTVTPSISGDADVSFTPPSLTFNAGDYTTGQGITVSAEADDDTVDVVATIEFAVTQVGPSSEYNGVTVPSVTANVTDPDRSAAVLPSSGSEITTLAVLEESTATYGVALFASTGQR